MADVAPKHKTTPRERIAQLVRMLGASEDGVWENAWCALVHEMHRAGMDFNDIGNAFEHGEHDESKYTEEEMLEFAQVARAEGVEEGVKLGLARASGNDKPNGDLLLPKPVEMAELCSRRLAYLRSDRDREFISEMLVKTQYGQKLIAAHLRVFGKPFHRDRWEDVMPDPAQRNT